MIIAKIDDYDVGIVFAERYRSILGNTLANEHEELNFIIIIDIDISISYRSINDNDVSIFAKKYGGGGHKNASGSGIDKNIKNKIIELLFNDVIIK